MDNKELVPVEKVLDDMYSDKAMVSSMARDYYYENYADDEEREQMDFEEKVANVISTLIVVGFAVIMILGLVNEFTMF